MLIRIKKNTDGSAALSCLRPDGSTTWQRQTGAQGRFFPLHDLTHFAVETELGLEQGFYGLVAEGWDLSDFAAPWARGRLPLEAAVAEFTVGFFDLERASGTSCSGAEYNAAAALHFAGQTLPGRYRLGDEDLARIRRRRGELFARWSALAPGDTLELEFSRPLRRADAS